MTARIAAELARTAYSLLLWLATPAYWARLWWRGGAEPLYRTALGERFGRSHQVAVPGRVWVHAVSLGETLAAQALVDEIRAAEPNVHILLTHGTATGRQAGLALLRDGDAQAWLPYDTPGAMRSFLRHHQPTVGVLMETEVWPNLLHQAQGLGVPMVLANARLSERSLRKGLRLALLMRPALASFKAVLAQTDDDAQRLRQMGAQTVEVMGNLKFDLTPDSALLTRGRAWRDALGGRPVVLMASSRAGEEAALLAAWQGLPTPRPLLLLVPRHPQRFDEVAGLVLASGLALQRRGAWATSPPASAAAADVWLGDSVGEMPLYYATAQAALLGGSFEPLGGHNLIEAAACGCPVVMGPHTFNFAQAAERSLAAGAAVRVDSLTRGVQQAVAVATDPQHGLFVQQALAFAAQHRGAARRMASQVLMLRVLRVLPVLRKPR